MNAKRPKVPSEAAPIPPASQACTGGQPKNNTIPMKPMPKVAPKHKALKAGGKY